MYGMKKNNATGLPTADDKSRNNQNNSKFGRINS